MQPRLPRTQKKPEGGPGSRTAQASATRRVLRTARYTRNRLDEEEVRLEFDLERTDRLGRTLAWWARAATSGGERSGLRPILLEVAIPSRVRRGVMNVSVQSGSDPPIRIRSQPTRSLNLRVVGVAPTGLLDI